MKTRLLLFLMLLWPSFAFAQGGVPADPIKVIDSQGRPRGGATVTICTSAATGVPCTPLASIFLDAALTQPATNPTTTDGLGNLPVVYAAPGTYKYTVTGVGITASGQPFTATVAGTGGGNVLSGSPNTFTAANIFNGPVTVSGTGTFTGPVLTKQLENTRYADQFAGADIFAQANAAATAAGSPGVVVIPPGTYSGVTTTLNCVNNVKFIVAGVTISTYTVSAGTAIKIQNVTGCSIEGPMLLKGPGSGTSSIGIQLGIGAGGSGTQLTIHNHLKDIKIAGFGKAFFGDGTTGGNGTYWNLIDNVATSDGSGNGNGIGFYLVPTTSQQFNNNVFNGCWGQYSTTDGWVIDGSYNSIITGADAENNGRYGMNFSGNAATISNTILGGHWEANTTADFNFGSGGTPSNISETQILGPFANSATPFVGNPNSGTFNVYQPSATPQRVNYPGGSTFLLPVNANAPAASIWQIFNSESPGSGITGLINLNRTGANAGTLSLCSPEYLCNINSDLLPGTAGTRALGSASLPWLTAKLGTAATNNFVITPKATAGARVWNVYDWGANGPAIQNQPFLTILNSQYTNSTTGFTNIAGGNTLQFTVEANTTYTAECHLYYQAASTGGLNIEFTGPASPTVVIYGLNDPSAATTFNSAVATAYSTSLGQVVGTAATNFDAVVSFALINGANAGTVNLLAKSSAAAQLQIQAGSFCRVQ